VVHTKKALKQRVYLYGPWGIEATEMFFENCLFVLPKYDFPAVLIY